MNEAFCRKLRQLRKSRNLSQAQLAQELFVSRSAVAKWEQNRGLPDIETLQNISALFGVKLDDLLSDKEIEIGSPISVKEISPKKKIIIPLSIVFLLVLFFLIYTEVLYHPRCISNYVEEDIKQFVKVEVENYDGKIYNIAESAQESFFNEILDISVIPKRFFVKKTISSYSIKLIFQNRTYEINQFFIYDGENRYYYELVNYEMYDYLTCNYLGLKL